MFVPLPAKFDFPQAERRVLEFWERHDVFGRSLAQRRAQGAERFVFYEGPPTANGLPHPGHCLTRAMKDLFPRYRTMCGYLCERKAGWDTHGLPVEVEVCKELGIHTKEEIEAYGVEKFVRKCVESVWRYTREWEYMTKRLGFWVNLDQAYATYHKSYVESVWWSLKTLFDRGLLYQGHKVVWWWAQGGTALSAGEVGEGYRTVDDPSVYVRFPLVGGTGTDLPDEPADVWQAVVTEAERTREPGPVDLENLDAFLRFVALFINIPQSLHQELGPAGNTARYLRERGENYVRKLAAPRSLLVWTTTPWTLVSNHFAAVHPALKYTLVYDAELGESLFIASELVENIAKKVKRELEPLCEFQGEELLDLRYVPPFRSVYYDRPFAEHPGLPNRPATWDDTKVRLGDLKAYRLEGGAVPIGWRVTAADFVSIESGTGLVHEAPAFGEVDFDLLQSERTKFEDPDVVPLLNAVRPDGTFNDDAPKQYRGRWVKECDKDIIRELKERGLLYHQETYRHEYPFCPRAENDPLIQYARKSWFVRTSRYKQEFLANNAAIHWLPEHIKEGRFGDFLRNNVDWALSRERYWGTPLPIWQCEACGRMEAVGSFEGLKSRAGATDGGFWERMKAEHPEMPDDLRVHKPYVDEWTYECGVCGGSAGVPPASGPGVPPASGRGTLEQPITRDLSKRRRHKLPHWEAGGSTYFLTFRVKSGELSPYERTVVLDACRHWDDVRIRLHAAVVMPDHVHLLCTPLERRQGEWWSVADLMHSIKGFTAQRINDIRTTTGTVWQAEYFDRIIRTETDFAEKSNYIVTNPERRGLPDDYAWVWVEPAHGPVESDRGPEARTPRGPEARTPRMRRVPEVIDCWWDAGSMPFAQWGFPHVSGSFDTFLERFPADFISEAIDQTRGWFYGLLAINTLLFGQDPGNVEHGRRLYDRLCESLGQPDLPAPMISTPEEEIEKHRRTGGPGAAWTWWYGHGNRQITPIVIAANPPLPYRTSIVLGHMMGEDGLKMSKRTKNYREPSYIFDHYGADAMRWYFFSAQTPWTSARFQEANIRDSQREFLVRLYNVFSFFNIYANIDGFEVGSHEATKPRSHEGERAERSRERESERSSGGGAAQSKIQNPKSKIAGTGWRPVGERSELDRWIVGELHRTIRFVREKMDAFENFPAAGRLNDFVDALSNWYVRRSRERFWKPVEGTAGGPVSDRSSSAVRPVEEKTGRRPVPRDQDKWDAYNTLYEVLLTLSKLIAPFTPFFAEMMYQNLTGSGSGDQGSGKSGTDGRDNPIPDPRSPIPASSPIPDPRCPIPLSVHLCDYPQADAALIDEQLAAEMDIVRELVSLGRSARTAAKLKVRQPLALVEIILARHEHEPWLASHAPLIAEELNVKQVDFATQADHYVSYQIKPDFKAIGPKFGKLAPQIAKALQSIDAAAARQKLADAGELPLQVGGETLSLSDADVQIRLEAKPGWSAAPGRAGVVVVKTDLTPELLDEGLIRELIHHVQGLRKELDLPYQARITLYVQTDEKLAEVIRRFEPTIRQECLAEQIVLGPPPGGVEMRELEIEGHAVSLGIR